MRAVALAVLAGCLHTVRPAIPPGPGVTIGLYGGDSPYAIVDERRALALDGDDVLLDHVVPGAELASLFVAVLDARGIAIDHCARPELVGEGSTAEVSPVVRCHVTGGHGRHLVRVVYVASGLTAKTEHAISVTDADHASLQSRFVIAMPRWDERAELVVYEAATPDRAEPRELSRGEVTLDGSTAVIGGPARDVAAHIRRIYSGAVSSPDVDASADSWHAESTHDVWLWLELDLAELAPGDLRVHVELPGEAARDVDVAHAIAAAAGELRVPLWGDPDLSGVRERLSASTGDDRVEQLTLAVANLGAIPREVWIEEQARPGKHRRLTGAHPEMPTIHGDLLRSIVEVAPRSVEHVRYTVRYNDDCKYVDC